MISNMINAVQMNRASPPNTTHHIHTHPILDQLRFVSFNGWCTYVAQAINKFIWNMRFISVVYTFFTPFVILQHFGLFSLFLSLFFYCIFLSIYVPWLRVWFDLIWFGWSQTFEGINKPNKFRVLGCTCCIYAHRLLIQRAAAAEKVRICGMIGSCSIMPLKNRAFWK